jgi:hypothetical protein
MRELPSDASSSKAVENYRRVEGNRCRITRSLASALDQNMGFFSVPAVRVLGVSVAAIDGDENKWNQSRRA